MLAAFLRRGTLACLLLAACLGAPAQQEGAPALGAVPSPSRQENAARRQAEDRRFLLRRGLAAPLAQAAVGDAAAVSTTVNTPGSSPEDALDTEARSLAATNPQPLLQAARAQQGVLAAEARTARSAQAGVQGSQARSPATRSSRAQAATPALNTSTTVWQPSGPAQINTASFGLVTGRVSALAVDPSDSSGNTVFLGATGGGVWKSINAANADPSQVRFTPLTDDLAVFADSNPSLPSLSIGALSVQPANRQVVLAGTGDTNDALDSYYGVGLLRSSNGGGTWNLIQNTSDSSYDFRGAGFAGFAWSTTNPNLVIAAVSSSRDSAIVNTRVSSSAENGLYYSTDAGQTWALSTITDGTNQIVQSSNPPTSPPGNAATSVVWNPQRGLFIAAIQFHGYYSSPDGVTWTRLANQPGSGLTTQNCPARAYGSGCPIFRGVLAVQPVTGDTFALTTDFNNLDQGLFRDVCSTSGTAVSRCNSGALSFGVQIADTALEDSGGHILFGDYNLSLAAVASQQDTILFAGIEDVYRCSLANSCTWRNTTNVETGQCAQVAPSTHAIDGTLGASGLIYFGNDGGLWRTTDTLAQSGPVCDPSDATHYQNLNGALGSLAEIAHLAVDPRNSALVLAGTGAFGTVASESAGAQANTAPWQQPLNGEGWGVAIDPVTPANWYAENGPGVAIFRCTAGSNCDANGFGTTPVIGRAQVQNDADYFLDPAPWILDPLNPNALLVGTCRMWLGPATGGWSASNLLSTPLDGTRNSFCNGNAQLRSVAAGGSYNSAQGGEQVYAGMAGLADGGGSVPGHLYGAVVPQNGGIQQWTDLWRNPVTNLSQTTQFNGSSYAISSIAVDPHDSTGRTLYVGVSGFPTGQSGVLYGSQDGGAHWTNITNSLPIAPVNAVVVDPNNSNYVYVGGDFGVYYTSNISGCSITGQGFQPCWKQLGANLPNAPVTDLKVFGTGSSGTALEAATYGRGIWTVGLNTTGVYPTATLSPANHTFAPGQAVGSTSPDRGNFTLSNTGTTTLNISQVSATPTSDYAQTNNCGSALAPGANCTILVSFTPSLTGDRPGSLTIGVNTQAGVLSASLDGTGLMPGTLTLTPTSYAFQTTATGASSQPLMVSVQNTGGAPLQLGARSFAGSNPGDYSLGSSDCGSTLNANASCTVAVTFTPTQTGSRTALLQVPANVQGSPFTVNLSGTGANPPALTLSANSLAFPDTVQGSASPSQSLTATNSGGLPAQLGTPTVTTGYTIANSGCGTSLAAGAACTVAIQFTPNSVGSRPGTFTLPSPSIPAGQVTATLNGNGLAPPSIAFSPNPVTFAAQQQNTTSAPQPVAVTNSAGSAGQLGTPTVSGDFAIVSNNCPASLAVNATCTITLSFTPSVAGTRTGTLTLPVNSGSVTDSLSGTGTAPGTLLFTPTTVSFAATAQGTSSGAQTLTVRNNGSSPAQISSTAITAPFGIVANSCPIPPQSLAVNATCTLQLNFTPPGTAAYTGTLTLGGNFSNSPAQVALNGQGATPPAATLSPGTLSFPDTPQGSATSTQNLTIASTGGVAVRLDPPSISPDYQISANNCPTTLAPGSSCTVGVLFHPAAIGARSGTFSQPGNMANSPLTANLTGNGLIPGSITLTPSNLAFGSAVIGSTTAPQPATVHNSGGAPVNLGTPATSSSEYVLSSSSCGASLGADQSCTLTVAFRPASAGSQPGQLTVPGDGSTASATTTLAGTGTTPGQLAAQPTSLGYGAVATGSGATRSVTVSNSGGTPANVSSIQATGDYTVTGGSCGTASPIPANGGSCTVAVTFSPATSGNRSGTLTLANDGSPPSLVVQLAGVGAAPGNLALSPSSVAFGSVVIGTASTARTVTASNSGGVAVSLGQAAVSGAGYAIQNNQCGSSLAAQSTCTLQVVFTPAGVGPSTGSLSLPGSYSGSPATVPLSGTGVTPGALTFTPNPASFGPTVVNSTATRTVTLQNIGGAPVSLGTPTAASPFSAVGNCPSSLAPGASCALQVSYRPVATGSSSGLLTVPASVSGGSATEPLSGTGVLPGALAASPGMLTYAATPVGSSAAEQTATFRNSGGVSVPLAPPRSSSTEYSITSNNCGASLDPGASCVVGVTFTPTAAGSRSGTLTLAASAAGGPSAQVALVGNGLARAALQLAPASLSFGSQSDQGQSAPQTLTLTNSGGVATSLAPILLSGEYAVASNSCANTLAAGATCQIAVRFTPVSTGSDPGSVTASSGDGTLRASAQLSGTGLALALSPTVINFPVALATGTSSSPIAVSIQNLGSSPLVLQPFTITGDFATQQSSCGSVLAGDASCAVYIIFRPTARGQRTGLFTVTGGTETQTVRLNGSGLQAATDTLSPSSLSFSPTAVNRVSAAQAVTLTNNGDATLTGIAVQVSGVYQAANNCGTSLGGHLSCSVAISFRPAEVGPASGTLSIADDQRTQTVALTGQGVPPPQAFVSPDSVNFGPYAQSATTDPQVITVSNPGSTPLTDVAVQVNGTDFVLRSSSCGATLAPGGNCQVAVVFGPSIIGSRQGTVQVTSSALSAPLVTSLAGSGEDFTLSVVGTTQSVLTEGQTASFQLALAPVGASSGAVAMSCSGAPVNASCVVTPAALTPAVGVTGSVVLTVATSVNATRAALAGQSPAAGNGWRGWAAPVLLALLCPVLFLRGRDRQRLLLALAAVALLGAPLACGVHASGAHIAQVQTAAGMTPSGTYTVIVTAAFPGAQRLVTVNVIVQ